MPFVLPIIAACLLLVPNKPGTAGIRRNNRNRCCIVSSSRTRLSPTLAVSLSASSISAVSNEVCMVDKNPYTNYSQQHCRRTYVHVIQLFQYFNSTTCITISLVLTSLFPYLRISSHISTTTASHINNQQDGHGVNCCSCCSSMLHSWRCRSCTSYECTSCKLVEATSKQKYIAPP